MKRLQLILAVFSVVFPLIPFTAAATTNIMALIPGETQFQKVLEGMQSVLTTDYKIAVVTISKSVKIEKVALQCKESDIKAFILMDATAIDIVGDLQKTDSSFAAMPKFVFMTLQVEAKTKGLSNVAGIRFEVPIYTLINNFRSISQKKFSNVGIFYRKSCSGSIREAKEMLDKEQIALQAVCVDCEKSEETTPQEVISIMEHSFDKMVKHQGTEVFLALADNIILNNASLNDFWIKKVKKENIPVITQFEMPASRNVGLAVFAAGPNLTQLGAQGAYLIIEYFENGSSLTTIGFEPAIAIKLTLNELVAKELGWHLKTEALEKIHHVIK